MKEKQEEEAKLKKKRPKKQKNQPQEQPPAENQATDSGERIVQFVLYEFDIGDNKPAEKH